MPSRATTFIGIPVDVPRMHHDALVHEPDADRLADRREHRHGGREAVAVDREAAQRVVRDPDVLAVVLDRVGLTGSTMNAPSSPRPTWSVALWCEWYISEPGVVGRELVRVRLARARSASGSRTARRPGRSRRTRRRGSGRRSSPCRLFVKIARTLSPCVDADRRARATACCSPAPRPAASARRSAARSRRWSGRTP